MTSVTASVMVGNGFDLKAGLKTGSRDFLKCFVNEPSVGPGKRVRNAVRKNVRQYDPSR